MGAGADAPSDPICIRRTLSALAARMVRTANHVWIGQRRVRRASICPGSKVKMKVALLTDIVNSDSGYLW